MRFLREGIRLLKSELRENIFFYIPNGISYCKVAMIVIVLVQ